MNFRLVFDRLFFRNKVWRQLTLQWHITDLCNLRCRHCYQETQDKRNPDFESLVDVLNQYIILLDRLKKTCNRKVKGHINITGGEPFIRDDFLALLNLIKKKRLSFSILTNGSLIDKATAKYLKVLSPRFIQVSMDGNKDTNDAIRGSGNFEKTAEALRLLSSNGLITVVSFTANRENYKHFPEVARKCRELGVNHLWSDRFIPSGRGEEVADMLLSPDETLAFFQLMYSSRSIEKKQSRITMHRAIKFQVSGEAVY